MTNTKETPNPLSMTDITATEVANTVSPPASNSSGGADKPRSDERSSDTAVTTSKPAKPQPGLKASPVNKMNALMHGAYARDFVLSWEDEAEFGRLHESFKQEWEPHGASEETAVLGLTHWTWKRQRATKLIQIRFFRSPVAQSLKSGESTWDELIRHESETVPRWVDLATSNTTMLINNFRMLVKAIAEHHYWTDTTEGKQIQLQLAKMRTDVGELATGVEEGLLGLIKQFADEVEASSNLFTSAYDPDEIETQTRILSMIDREIDKSVRRLIYLKTFKRIELGNSHSANMQNSGTKMLQSPSTVPEPNEVNETIDTVTESKSGEE